MQNTTSKAFRRLQRRITANVKRMPHNMTCHVALWPEAGPHSCRELNKPWRALKRIIAKRIEDRLCELERDICSTAYLQAQNMAATPEEHARIHQAALNTFPKFPRLLNSLYRNYQQ
ncbi:hypothetical protein PN823_004456 [Enterobacter hormaechei]|nr:hypothetical protein [Enterobacter hormaechei]